MSRGRQPARCLLMSMSSVSFMRFRIRLVMLLVGEVYGLSDEHTTEEREDEGLQERDEHLQTENLHAAEHDRDRDHETNGCARSAGHGDEADQYRQEDVPGA